jgi:hypothetical protein
MSKESFYMTNKSFSNIKESSSVVKECSLPAKECPKVSNQCPSEVGFRVFYLNFHFSNVENKIGIDAARQFATIFIVSLFDWRIVSGNIRGRIERL